MKTRGFSLLELVVVIAIIGLLAAILIPAVQSARESARRTHCSSNLREILLGVMNYESVHREFPPGSSRGFSCHVNILPFVEQFALAEKIDYARGEADIDPSIQRVTNDLYLCPSDGSARTQGGMLLGATNYACNFGTGVRRDGYNGVFQNLIADGSVRASDITDGLSNTAAMSEMLVSDGSAALRRVNWDTVDPLHDATQEEFAEYCRAGTGIHEGNPWFRGRPWTHGDPGFTWYNHILPPNAPSCKWGGIPEGAYAPGSNHTNGVVCAYADGHLEFISSTIDLTVWRDMGSRGQTR